MVKSLVVPSSVYSLVSLPTRLVQGWKWTAEGKTAQLESPEGDSYVFKLVKGLFRYRGKAKTRDGMHRWQEEKERSLSEK